MPFGLFLSLLKSSWSFFRHKRSSARPEARRRAEDTKSVDLITHLLAANIFAFRAISKGKSKARYVSDSEDKPRSTVDKRRATR